MLRLREGQVVSSHQLKIIIKKYILITNKINYTGSMYLQAENGDLAFTDSGTSTYFYNQHILLYSWWLKFLRWILLPGEYIFLYCRQLIQEKVKGNIRRNECWFTCFVGQNIFQKKTFNKTHCIYRDLPKD